MKPVFCVQVWCSEQWMTLEGAEALERHAANAVYHQEIQIAGAGRARMVPVRPKVDVELVYAEHDDPVAKARVVELLKEMLTMPKKADETPECFPSAEKTDLRPLRKPRIERGEFKFCRRCNPVRQKGWQCRNCPRRVCEHFCGHKDPKTGAATCDRCIRNSTFGQP
jgi:hypothetical protein